MGYDITGRQENLGAKNSLQTGNPWFVGDFQQLSVSIQSSTGSASRYTILGTNLDGFQSTLSSANPTIPANGWSIVTVLTAQGLYSVDVGFRWVNAVRDAISVSAASNCTIVFAGRT